MFIFVLREIKEWLEFIVGMIPGKTGLILRGFYYKYRLRKCLKENRFETGLRIEYPKNVTFGSSCYLGFHCKIYASKSSKVDIGSNIAGNSNVMINAIFEPISTLLDFDAYILQ
jgi:acetyltransferase-like isoleucine patch superfamily enzyme